MEENKSSRIFLISAIVLGVLATAITFAYLQQYSGDDKKATVKILVAARDLETSAVLEPQRDVEEADVPARFAAFQSRCVTPAQRAALKGQRINRRILAQTPIMLADLTAEAPLSLSLKDDFRAMSIQARGAHGLRGILGPGDFVKVMVTGPSGRRSTSQPSSNWETRCITDNPIRVLAVGARVTRAAGRISAMDQYAMANESDAAQSVTLEVTEEQARTILEQSGGGQLPLTLILCPLPKE